MINCQVQTSVYYVRDYAGPNLWVDPRFSNANKTLCFEQQRVRLSSHQWTKSIIQVLLAKFIEWATNLNQPILTIFLFYLWDLEHSHLPSISEGYRITPSYFLSDYLSLNDHVYNIRHEIFFTTEQFINSIQTLICHNLQQI